MNRRIKTITIFSLLIAFIPIYSQEKSDVPKYSLFRQNENYEYLQSGSNTSYKKDLFDPIKFIPINKKETIYISLGGQLRPRFEYFSNRNWISDSDENFYSQRIAFHTDIVLGKHVRLFGELYHGYTSHEKEFAQSDNLDFHQAFLDIKFSTGENSKITFRLGRQELAYGAARLIGFREGPNIRRSFDASRVIYKVGSANIQAFYGKEVRPAFGSFDNEFTFFNSDVNNPQLWGLYTQFKIKNFTGRNEIYYLGFQSNQSRFNDVFGEETRHSIGVRRYGKLGKRFSYNTELIYQFGKIDQSNISAFNIETDWYYQLINTSWKIKPGLKLEYTSGDNEIGDGKINTFNPLFVNPAYYSLAATITPVNMVSIHPSVTMTPTEKLKLYFEWGIFWRASKNDGLYSPPRFISRQMNGLSDKGLGNQLGFKATYEINRHLSFDLDMSYFIAGDFQKSSGESANIFHLAPTFSYKF
ncbi:alginate export family protein [Tenacibaculum xiamenense]|uniref:alginate export family protein n=1 Tax=Tenacibaculum xiamenense TaxID=1261553 RepID=UPI003893F282